MMDDKNTVFDDIMQGLHELEEYEKGNIELRTNTIEISDEEWERRQLLWHMMVKLPVSKTQEAVKYMDELLRA